tara:strand:+ start:289 stop:840 length:552 start_codon:yes stop_codon:yes gene_type:complete
MKKLILLLFIPLLSFSSYSQESDETSLEEYQSFYGETCLDEGYGDNIGLPRYNFQDMLNLDEEDIQTLCQAYGDIAGAIEWWRGEMTKETLTKTVDIMFNHDKNTKSEIWCSKCSSYIEVPSILYDIRRLAYTSAKASEEYIRDNRYLLYRLLKEAAKQYRDGYDSFYWVKNSMVDYCENYCK